MRKRCLQNLLLLSLLWLGQTGSTALPPEVPGYRHIADEQALLRGELLLGELNCLSCHAAPAPVAERIPAKTAPDLSRAGERLTPQYLRKFLAAPHAVKPGATMPDIFHSSEPASRDGAVDFLVHFLVSRGGPVETRGQAGTSVLREEGERLFHTVGCAACHAPARAPDFSGPSIPLDNLAQKTTLDQLAGFLLDPLKVRPSGRMPSLTLEEREARALAVYLLEEQMANPQSLEQGPGKTPGLAFEYYQVSGLERLPDFDELEPAASGTVDTFTLDLPIERRSQDFALRYRGLITIPTAGEYRFSTRSDDGSQLYINGRRVVENDALQGMTQRSGQIELIAGDQEIEVRYFQAGGEYGLQVLWSGPGLPRRGQPIPPEALWNSAGDPMVPLESEVFVLDRRKAEMGARMFSVLRCISCHEVEGLPPVTPSKPLGSLVVNNAEGCLGVNIRRGLPDYRLSDRQRADLELALNRSAEFSRPLDPVEQVHRTLLRMNCYACHERDGIGGPDHQRQAFFQTAFPIDLGEEGAIPPSLTGVGAKLRGPALERILVEGELHVREYMATRMPLFGAANLRGFLDHVAAVDGADRFSQEPPFSEESWKTGHLLTGTEGMSCVACHNLAGQAAVGIRGIDLATAYDRLNPGWFKQFLLDPSAFKRETRMPEFWPDGESPFPEVAGGNAERQIEGIWSYLSLRNSMPLPSGIDPAGTAGMELIPAGEPIVHRTFMAEVGPRAILAGYPEKVHVAFDANAVRLAQTWRGRFFDARGVASGRTDQFLGPLGEDVLRLPAGPAFAFLSSEQAPWPRPERLDRNVGGSFRGYHLDAQRRPVFRYQLDRVEIAEQPVPIVQPGGAILSRRFTLTAPGAVENLFFLAASGERVEPLEAGVWSVDGAQQVSLPSSVAARAFVRISEGRTELLAPMVFQAGTVEFETVLKW